MEISISILNLWLPFLIIYASIWIYMIFINKKIGRPIEDPEIYVVQSKNERFIIGFLPTLLLFIVSIFVPIQFGLLVKIGVIISIIGFYLNLLCFNAFVANQNPLNTKGIYNYSRNPMYVSGLMIFIGLVVMSWNKSVESYTFIFRLFIWILGTHYAVLKEEKFLEKKYGEDYLNYKKKVRRYI
jgi:protein-S-isoprenylcysteine O-methyltransferase Ste14